MQTETISNVKRISALLLAALLIIQTFWIMPNLSYAGSGDGITLKVGVSDLPVKITFDGKSDSGKTGQTGNFKSEKLYEYLADELGWEGQVPAEGEESAPITKKQVTVSYEINYPDASDAYERQALGGDPAHKGKKGTITLAYDEEHPDKWKDAAELEAPSAEAVISGIVKIIPPGKSEPAATIASGIPVTIKGTSRTMDTTSGGRFIFYGYSKETTPDSKISIAATGEHPAFEVSMGDFDGTIYLKQRPNISAQDFEIVGAENGYVSEPKEDTTYQIKGKDGNLVTLLRDGEGKESINVTLKKDDFSTTTFYVIKDGVCSDEVKNAIKVDNTPPELTGIETEAVNEVYIKDHGIYTKKKAELLLTITVKDTESGVGTISLIGKDDEGKTTYKTSKITEKGNSKAATFVIESQKDLMKQTLYLICYDKVGNKTNEVLIRGSEDASEITLEILPPIVDETTVVKGTINENGWYKEALGLRDIIQDAESGLSDVVITTNNGKVLYKHDYKSKVLTKQTIDFDLSAEDITKEANSKGEYVILTKASDNSGNITAKSITVKVDLVAPELSMTGVEEGAYLQKSPTINISEKENYVDAKGNHFRAVVKRNGKDVFDKTFNQVDKGTIPASTFSQDGNYSITVTGADAAGNKAERITRSFVKDATAPVVAIKGPAAGKYFNKAQNITVSVTERNYNTNNVTINCTRTLKGKTSKVNFPWRNTSSLSNSTISVKETGEYKITAYAVDKAGNKSSVKTLSFFVDTVAPTLNIGGVQEGKTYVYEDIVAPNITFGDDYLAGRTITLTRAGENWYPNLRKAEGSGSIRFSDFEKVKDNDGLYSMSVTVNDKAGNSTTKKVSFTVNRFGSSFKYNDAIKDINGESVTDVNASFEISEYNVSKLKKTVNEIKLDGEKLDGTSAKTEEAGKDAKGNNIYRHRFNADNFQSEGVYEINVLSEDEAGNTMESAKENGKIKFIVDRTNPTISLGNYEKVNKAETLPLTARVSDNLSNPVVTVTVDGTGIKVENNKDGSYSFTLEKGAGQHVDIKATDAAGNTETFTDTISVVPNGLLYTLIKYKFPIGGLAALLACGGGIFFALAKKKKKENNKEA